ncbi:MAG TPA: hypothetical protein VHB98_14605 [Chloroflexota bacterium]|nr:hypothetical protein [Chloroflexota bacterium]
MHSTIFEYHQRAAALGILLGGQQAAEHLRLTGAQQLNGTPLLIMAGLAWKYEGLPRVGDKSGMQAFVQAYVASYRSSTRLGD